MPSGYFKQLSMDTVAALFCGKHTENGRKFFAFGVGTKKVLAT